MNQVTRLVAAMSAAMAELRSVMADPDAVRFSDVHEAFIELERVWAGKAAVDAAFAYIADRDDAGRLVGSSQAQDYLVKKLRLSQADAHARVREGRELFAPRKAEPDLLGGLEAARLEEAERQAAADNKSAIARGAQVSFAVLNMIAAEIQHLNEHAVPGREQLKKLALDKQEELPLDELRAWLRNEIAAANKKALRPDGTKDEYAAVKKRRLSLSRPDADGGVHLHGYVDAATAALLKAAFSPARNSGSADLTPEEDKRTYPQRMADQLAAIVGNYLGSQQAARYGLGSVMIATTLEELESLTPSSRLATTVGVELRPLDLLRLGAAQHDLLCVVDDQGQPLELARAARTATLWQKVALAASELVCTHPGCDRPWQDCDVHHLQVWAHGGATDLKNLTLLCRRHHVDNNDRRDGVRNMGHAERCRETGRVGLKRPGSHRLEFNDHPAAARAPGRKLARAANDPPDVTLAG